MYGYLQGGQGRQQRPFALGWRQGKKRWSDERPEQNAVPSSPPPPVGDLVLSLRKRDTEEESAKYTDSASIHGCELVSSYNWVDKQGPATILVPGKPPYWNPPSRPATRLLQDQGRYFRDKNAARCPEHPMEAGIVASLSASPGLPAEVDVAACGSSLGSLLRFIRGVDKPFRMLVEKVQNTVFLIRRENSPTELIPDVWGYGHAFPEAYTDWEADVRGSGSHQRLIQYTFGGLRFLVRFEGDGYLSKKSQATPGPANVKKSQPSGNNSIDELLDLLAETEVDFQPSATPSSTVKMEMVGSIIQQDRVFDLKTRSIKSKDKKDHLNEELPRLWVSQIPNFILAFHTSGLFKREEIRVIDAREDIKKWEKEHNSDLACLAALIHRIVNLVSTTPDGKLELYHETVGKLDVRKQCPDAGNALSAETKARWVKASTRGEKPPLGRDDTPLQWDFGDENDFTACSSSCGYCGRCASLGD